MPQAGTLCAATPLQSSTFLPGAGGVVECVSRACVLLSAPLKLAELVQTTPSTKEQVTAVRRILVRVQQLMHSLNVAASVTQAIDLLHEEGSRDSLGDAQWQVAIAEAVELLQRLVVGSSHFGVQFVECGGLTVVKRWRILGSGGWSVVYLTVTL